MELILTRCVLYDVSVLIFDCGMTVKALCDGFKMFVGAGIRPTAQMWIFVVAVQSALSVHVSE